MKNMYNPKEVVMNKLRKYLIMMLFSSLILVGCSNNTNIKEEEPKYTDDLVIPNKEEEKMYINYNQYLITPNEKAYLNPDEELYKLLVDAINQFEPSLNIEGFTLDQEELESLADALYSRPEFPYLSGLSLDSINQVINIQYFGIYDRDTAIAYKDEYIRKIEYILNEVVDMSRSESEQVLAIYNWLSQCVYTIGIDGRTQGDIIVSQKGICTHYAYAMRTILDQLGIENHLAVSNDKSHVWNIVKMDGAYYHVDATYGSTTEKGRVTYWDFGKTDEQMYRNYDGWHSGGNSKYPKYELPKCVNERFKFLADSIYNTVDFETYEIFYTTEANENRCYNMDTQEDYLIKDELTSTNSVLLINHDELIEEGDKIKEAIGALKDESSTLNQDIFQKKKQEVIEMQKHYLELLDKAFETLSVDIDFNNAFSGEMKKEYTEHIRNSKTKQFINTVYNAGFILLKDAGYIYPIIDESIWNIK